MYALKTPCIRTYSELVNTYTNESIRSTLTQNFLNFEKKYRLKLKHNLATYRVQHCSV